MGFILSYSIKSAIILTVIFAIYMITAKQIKGATLRRGILIGIYVATVIIPLVDFNLFPMESSPITLEGIRTSGEQPSAVSLSTSPILFRTLGQILIGGIIVLILQLLFTFLHVTYLRIKGRTTVIDGIDITVIDQRSFSPFCFGNRMFVSASEFDEMADMVFCHEKSHIYRNHFLDLLFARVITIIQWWNPFAWLMQRELQDVHEFQADEDVLDDGYPLREYQFLLLNRAAGRIIPNPVPSHGIRRSRLRHRLRMMNESRNTRGRLASILLLLPALGAGVMIIASPLVSPILLSAAKVGRTISLPTGDRRNEPEYMVNGISVSPSYIQKLSPSLIKSMTVRKDSPDHPKGLIEIQLKTDEIPDLQNPETDMPPQTLDEVMVVAPAMPRPKQPA